MRRLKGQGNVCGPPEPASECIRFCLRRFGELSQKAIHQKRGCAKGRLELFLTTMVAAIKMILFVLQNAAVRLASALHTGVARPSLPTLSDKGFDTCRKACP